MGKPYLIIDLSVKFRAFGITFGTVKEHLTTPLPLEVGFILQLPGNKTFFGYNKHGIVLTLTLTNQAGE